MDDHPFERTPVRHALASPLFSNAPFSQATEYIHFASTLLKGTVETKREIATNERLRVRKGIRVALSGPSERLPTQCRVAKTLSNESQVESAYVTRMEPTTNG